MVGNGPVRRLDHDEVISFATANGCITTEIVAPMFCEELKDLVEPLVLPETPAVLSVGRRCMHMGYGFHWHPGQNPSLVTPEGKVISLLVKKDIPYMSVGSLRSSSKRAKDCTGAPVASAVKQDKDDIGPGPGSITNDECAPSQGRPDIAQSGNAEGHQECNPYGYSGPLSGKCEIPLAVLEQAY